MSNIPQGATHEFKDWDGAGAKYYRKGAEGWECHFDKEWRRSGNGDEWLTNNLTLLVAPTQAHDTVQNPKHYQLLPGVEVYDVRQALAAKATAAGATLDQFSDYDRAVEYLLRMWEKNGVEDAQKAAWYLNKLVGKLNGSGA